MFSIGVGNYRLSELQEVASEPKCSHVLTLTAYDQITAILTQIQKSACEGQAIHHYIITVAHLLLRSTFITGSQMVFNISDVRVLFFFKYLSIFVVFVSVIDMIIVFVAAVDADLSSPSPTVVRWLSVRIRFCMVD